MPEYTFVCEKCNHKFTDILSFAQYDAKAYKCEKCKSKKLNRCYQDDCINIAGSIKKSDSELGTLGDLADRNRDRMSEDHKEHLFRKHNEYRFNKPDDPLPTGMSRLKKPSKRKWKWTDQQTTSKKRKKPS